MKPVEHYLGIDFGETRIGLALANSIAKLPSPYSILPNDAEIFKNLEAVISGEKIDKLVVGLPRDMSGRETEQSKAARRFAGDLARHTSKPLVFADESLSSIRAADSRGYKKSPSKHQDDIAACYILEEYLSDKL